MLEADSLSFGATVRIRLRAAASAPIEGVLLRTCPDGEESLVPMKALRSSRTWRAGFQWWTLDTRLVMPRLGYRFCLRTLQGSWWYNQEGLHRHQPTDAADFAILADFEGPSWLPGAVFYQVFPDRFAPGLPPAGHAPLSPLPDRLVRPWGEAPRSHRKTGGIEHFGGNLWGIVEHLDHLASLGVTALYLNPIFASPSNHKYDVADYDRVDEGFGGNDALAALRQALDARGMRYILDVTPNHCGVTHPWFVEAVRDPASPVREFFKFYERPHEYECWMGCKTLPKLDYRSPLLRERMYEGPDAILRQWLRPPYGADGWRLDVANMLARSGAHQLAHEVGRGIRRAVKDTRREAYLLGEHFHDGTPHLQGDELDASMNYRGFMFPLLDWLAPGGGLPEEALLRQWQVFLAAVPWQVARQQFNLVGSHDTPRVLTRLGGDRRLARAAATLLFSFPGVPCVYYGDEIGMEGAHDPDNRACMSWDGRSWDGSLLAHYRRLGALRRTSSALRDGSWQPLDASDDVVAFARESAAECLVVAACRGDEGPAGLDVAAVGLDDGTPLREMLTGSETVVRKGRLPLPGLGEAGAQIWAADLRAPRGRP